MLRWYYTVQVGRWVTAVVVVAAAPKTKPEQFLAYSSVKGVCFVLVVETWNDEMWMTIDDASRYYRSVEPTTRRYIVVILLWPYERVPKTTSRVRIYHDLRLTGSGGRSLVSWIRTVVTVGALPRWWRGHCRCTVVVVAVDKIVLVSAALLSSRAYLIAVREIVWRTSVHPRVSACAVAPTQTTNMVTDGHRFPAAVTSGEGRNDNSDRLLPPIAKTLPPPPHSSTAPATTLPAVLIVCARRRIVTKKQIIACVALWQY